MSTGSGVPVTGANSTGVTVPDLADENHLPKKLHRVARAVIAVAKDQIKLVVVVCSMCTKSSVPAIVKKYTRSKDGVITVTSRLGKHEVRLDLLSDQIAKGYGVLHLECYACHKCMASPVTNVPVVTYPRCARCRNIHNSQSEYCTRCDTLAASPLEASTMSSGPRVSCPVCTLRSSDCVCDHLNYDATRDWFGHSDG